MGNDHVEPLPRQRWRNLCNSRSSRKSTYDLFLRSVHTKNIRSRRNTLKTIHTDRNNNTMNLTSRLLFAMTLAKWTTIAGGRYGTGYEFLPAIFPFIVPEKFDPSSEMVDYYYSLLAMIKSKLVHLMHATSHHAWIAFDPENQPAACSLRFPILFWCFQGGSERNLDLRECNVHWLSCPYTTINLIRYARQSLSIKWQKAGFRRLDASSLGRWSHRRFSLSTYLPSSAGC